MSQLKNKFFNESTQKFEKILAALFYAVASLAVILINKVVLTTYAFPFFIFLAAVQFVATSIIILALVYFKKVDVPALSGGIFIEVVPISAMFLGNVICGLGSTKSLNLPMFTALRRFSILMTMFGEVFVLNKIPSISVVISVLMMVGGALVAAYYDLAFDLQGYVLVLLNDLFTALSGVYMKKATISSKCSKMGVLFYNSLFSAVALFIVFAVEHMRYIYSMDIPGTIDNNKKTISTAVPYDSTINQVGSFEGWNDPHFIGLFMVAALMGSVLNYSIFLCTHVNSALTTAVVGCLKNVLTTYIGMIFIGDYVFHVLNFLGLNISIFGSLYYTYVTMVKGLPGFGGG